MLFVWKESAVMDATSNTCLQLLPLCLRPTQKRISVWVGEQSSAFLAIGKSWECIPLGKVLL